MSKMCYFDGVLCTVEKTENGYILTKVPSIETFVNEKPVKAVKSDKKINLGNLGKENTSIPTPIESEKTQSIKPTKKAKTDIVQTQKSSNEVQNGSYKVSISGKVLEIACPDGAIITHQNKTEIKTDNFAKTGYLKVLEQKIGKLSEHQQSDCFGYAKYNDTVKKYVITVRNSAK